jgi:hypothetical protein
MDLHSTILLPEGAIPLNDASFLRSRFFTPAYLRKPFLGGLRPLLERARITEATPETVAKFRELLSDVIFSSPSLLRPFFSLYGGTDTQQQEWLRVVIDNLDIGSLLDNITAEEKGGKHKGEEAETLDATAQSPMREVSGTLSQSSLSDVTFKPTGAYSVGDWVTITVAAVAKPALLATLYVLKVRSTPEDSPIVFARNCASFLRQDVQLSSLFKTGLLPIYKFAVADYQETLRLSAPEVLAGSGVKGFTAVFAAMLPTELVAKLDKKARFGSMAKNYVDLANIVTASNHMVLSVEDEMEKAAQLSRVAVKEAKAEVSKAIRTAVAAVPPAAQPPPPKTPARKTAPAASALAPPPPSQSDSYPPNEESDTLMVAAVGAPPVTVKRGQIRNGFDMDGNCGLCHMPGHAKGKCAHYHCRGCHKDGPGHTWGACKINAYPTVHQSCEACQANKLAKQGF